MYDLHDASQHSRWIEQRLNCNEAPQNSTINENSKVHTNSKKKKKVTFKTMHIHVQLTAFTANKNTHDDLHWSLQRTTREAALPRRRRLGYLARHGSTRSWHGTARDVPGFGHKTHCGPDDMHWKVSMEIWKSGNLEVWDPKKTNEHTILKIKICSAQNADKVRISRKTKNSWPFFKAFQIIFPSTRKCKIV